MSKNHEIWGEPPKNGYSDIVPISKTALLSVSRIMNAKGRLASNTTFLGSSPPAEPSIPITVTAANSVPFSDTSTLA